MAAALGTNVNDKDRGHNHVSLNRDYEEPDLGWLYGTSIPALGCQSMNFFYVRDTMSLYFMFLF